jgi:ubiquinone/menaquinone biosynthesis C-methylase UbiE
MAIPENSYIAFDRVAELYESTRFIPENVMQEAVRYILQNIPDDIKEGAFLDAGVGTGRFARRLYAEGVHLVGVDVSLPMLQQARILGGNFPAVLANLCHLPFSSDSFSGALMVHILHLISNWTDALMEVLRVLRPGCPLFLGTESGKRFEGADIYFDIAEREGLKRPHIGAPNLEVVIGFLRAMGAHVERIDEGRFHWTSEITAGRLLSFLRQNPYSQCWSIHPESHQAIILELEDRLQSLGIKEDTLLQSPSELIIWSVLQ